MKSFSMLTMVALTVSAFTASAAAAGSPESHQYSVYICGGEPCDAVIRGSFAFSDRHLHGLKGNGRACADCHMPQDQFQLSPASVEARFRTLEWRRLWNPRADDPLFRPIDADDFRTNGAQANDFSNLRQNGLIRVVMPLPSNVKLIDPLSGQPSAETSVDIWRSVPTVNDVKLTGPNSTISWPRGPNPGGGFQLDARLGTLQEQALGALRNHAEIQNAPRNDCWTTSPRSSGCCFRTRKCGLFRMPSAPASRRCRIRIRDSMQSRHRARQSSSAPARNATAGRTSPRPSGRRCPSSAITTSCRAVRGRSIP